MENIIFRLLIQMAHLSVKLTAVAEEIDKIYETIGNQEFIDMIKELEHK